MGTPNKKDELNKSVSIWLLAIGSLWFLFQMIFVLCKITGEFPEAVWYWVLSPTIIPMAVIVFFVLIYILLRTRV